MYEFTQDWFTPNLPQWEQFLLPLAGKPCKLLEIGSFEGRSAFWVADNLLSHSYSRLTCIDNWCVDIMYSMGGQQLFDRNLANCHRNNQIIKLSGNSEDILPTLSKGSYDFAYIDGGHDARQVVTDWVLVLRLMKPGGLVCFDDYEWCDPGNSVRILPKPAINCVLDFWADKVTVLRQGYQVWLQV